MNLKVFTTMCLVALFVLSANAQNWSEVIKVAASDREESAIFGVSVSIDGNQAVVGAQDEDKDALGANTLSNAGAAYVFTKIGGVWTQTSKLVSGDRQIGGRFGCAVAIDGNQMIIGAREESNDANGLNPVSSAGAAYIFTKIAGVWTQTAKLVANDRFSVDLFGFSVDIEGNEAVIGSNLNNRDQNGLNPLSNAGAAYIFTNNAGTWSQTVKLNPNDRGQADQFGQSVAISNNQVLVGTLAEDEDANGANTLIDAGSAYIFTKTAGVWGQSAKLVANDRAANDRFGQSVDIQNDYIVIGSYLHDNDQNGLNPLNNPGAAYVFKNTGGVWTQTAKMVASDRAMDDHFGIGVAIDGDYIIVGAFNEDEDANGANTLSNAGSAYVFHKSGMVWSQQNKLVASDRDIEDQFGLKLAIDGNQVLISTTYDDEDASGGNMLSNAGSAYFFENVPPCSISAISAGTQSACVNSMYDQEVIVTYNNAPSTGTLNVNGQSFAITTSPQTVTLVGLVADGNPVNVTAQFSDDVACSLTINALFTAPAACPAQPATGLHFDGVDDFVDMGDVAGDFGLSHFTVELWVKTNQVPSPGTNISLISKRDICGASNFWNFVMSNSGYLYFEAYESNAGPWYALPITTPINDNIWHHVAAVFDGTTISVYLDGVLSNSGLMGGLNHSNSASLQLGRNACSNTPWGEYFEGTLDEVRIWHTDKTETELANNKDCELVGNEPHLAAYYNFNTGLNSANNAGLTTLADQSSNSHDGTLTNFALNGPTSNWIEGQTMSGPCAAPCATTNIFSPMAINANYAAAGANAPFTYYWGLSDGYIKANPTGGVGPYTYLWSSSAGYTIKNDTKQRARLWYPSSAQWVKVAITDVGAGCTIEDSIYIDWIDYTCNQPFIWYYELCNTSTGVSSCVQGTANMRNLIATGNYTFGPCNLPSKTGWANSNENATFGVNVFPNPSNGEFTYVVMGEEGAAYFTQVIDLNGRILFAETFDSNQSISSREISLSNLAKGIYFIKVSGKNNSSVQRISIQ